jgi:hypothetical protein
MNRVQRGGATVRFEEHYKRDGAAAAQGVDVGTLEKIEAHASGIKAFFTKYSGATFNNGLYRVLPADQIKKWTKIVEALYPQYKGKIVTFASDWFGRVFALDATRVEGGQYQVVLLDPAAGDALDIPCSFASFHNEELCDYPNEALEAENYGQWITAKGVAPKSNECVGYIKPLVLGGVDDIPNQEITDMEVYWSICTQIKQQVDKLPEGTKIDKIELE